MPLNALGAVDVDYRCDAGDIPAMLARLTGLAVGTTVPVPPELMLEVEIALGRPCDTETMTRLGDPSPVSCPTCGGVLSQMRAVGPTRYRCQVGHAYTAEVLNNEQEANADEALRVALRIVEERITLLKNMVAADTKSERHRSAQMYRERLSEYERNAETIRTFLMKRDLT